MEKRREWESGARDFCSDDDVVDEVVIELEYVSFQFGVIRVLGGNWVSVNSTI